METKVFIITKQNDDNSTSILAVCDTRETACKYAKYFSDKFEVHIRMEAIRTKAPVWMI